MGQKREYIPLGLDEVRQALLFIPADDREVWINIGNALKTEFDDAGWDLWDSWSQSSDKYKAGDAWKKWKSLKPGKVSIRYLDKLARNSGWRRERRELTPEEKQRLKAEAEERRRLVAEKVEADEAKLERMQLAVAEACQRVLEVHLNEQGASSYLERKGVGAHGVLFPCRAVLVNVDSQRERVDIWAGEE
ncbi:PriCT-2 domain-containing protein, partial [Rossellomorea vietnamensis]